MGARDTTQRTGAAAGLVLAAVMALAGCSDDGGEDPAGTDGGAQGAGGPTVVVKDTAFTPSEVTVDAGQTVTWRFEDGTTEHTVTGATFQSEPRSSGVFEHTFDQPGTSTYQCTIHPDMEGRVVVR